jgi:hypothetical protein
LAASTSTSTQNFPLRFTLASISTDTSALISPLGFAIAIAIITASTSATATATTQISLL